MTNISLLFNKQITWKFVKPGGIEFYAIVDGQKCELRMNNFPEEPLYTLEYMNQTIDFDDRPKTWKLPTLNGS